MQEWLKTQAANNFAAFAGARVSAAIPLRESMLNSWLDAALKNPAALGTTASNEIPIPLLTRLVAAARVEITDGILTLHLDLKV